MRAPYLRRFIKKHIPANRNIRILDLGCGNGTLLHFLKEAGYCNVFGIDTSPEQIGQARQQGVCEVELGEVFPFLQDSDGGSYDVVIAFDLIEHLTKPELFDLADEVYRILTPDGQWIAHAPNAEGLFGAKIRYADLTHQQAFTRESVSQLTNAAGFRRVDSFEDSPVVHSFKSLLRWIVWKSARAVVRVYLMAETGETGRNFVLSQNLLMCAVK